MTPILYMVVPCYNEEAVLPETTRRLAAKYDALIEKGIISAESRIVYVNDGSSDRTWTMIQDYHTQDERFSGLNLSRNRGHQNALLAGLMTVRELADCVISMDADLQDDINAIDEMLAAFAAGSDVVYGVRNNRDSDSWFKRNTAGAFYKLMGTLGSQGLPNSADFRLMSARALAGLAEFPEVNLFLRGMVPLVGYPSSVVYYKRSERFAGESKYPLNKMIGLAVDGVTSSSAAPLRLIFWAGLLIFLLAVLAGIGIIVRHFVDPHVVIGWPSIMCTIVAFGGLNLLALGVIGEYLGKVFTEVKQRPRFIVQDFLNHK